MRVSLAQRGTAAAPARFCVVPDKMKIKEEQRRICQNVCKVPKKNKETSATSCYRPPSHCCQPRALYLRQEGAKKLPRTVRPKMAVPRWPPEEAEQGKMHSDVPEGEEKVAVREILPMMMRRMFLG